MLANKESFSYHSCPNAITLIKSNSKNYFLLYIQSVLCHKQIVQFSNFISFTKKKNEMMNFSENSHNCYSIGKNNYVPIFIKIYHIFRYVAKRSKYITI